MGETKALKNELTLVLDLIEIALAAEKDGEISWSDLGLLTKLVPDLGPAIASLSEVPAELSHLTAEDSADLVAHVMLKLSIDDAKARDVIAQSLKLTACAYSLFKAVKA